MATDGLLRTAGSRFVDGNGVPVRLRGVGLGGWMNMENFITGYAANEALMRRTVCEVLGRDRYELFFERLLTVFFDTDDAALLASLGMNCVRIPINYRHFESDDRPFEFTADGFRHLDRVIDACAQHGLWSIIDLHALPGAQNHHWHSDNETHLPMFWNHPHFQDRAVALWEIIADRYKGDPRIAGYNPINEPACENRAAVRTVYRRLASAIRAVDPEHILFLDGNTYSTEFDVFDGQLENVVYACHDYAAPGFVRGGDYPGVTNGLYVDKGALADKYRNRTEYSRKTDTPVWVGEFGPVYRGDQRRDAMRYQILANQLDIYHDDQASWSIWTYKDIGCQGIAVVRPDSAYRSRFDGFVAKKDRLGADLWGSHGDDIWPVSEQFQDKLAQEFPVSPPTRGAAGTGPGRSCSTSQWPSRWPTSTPSCSAASVTTTCSRWPIPSRWPTAISADRWSNACGRTCPARRRRPGGSDHRTARGATTAAVAPCRRGTPRMNRNGLPAAPRTSSAVRMFSRM